MKHRSIRYLLMAAGWAIILSQAVYVRNLEEVKAGILAARFNPAAYAENLWHNELPERLIQAVDIDRLTGLLQTDPTTAFNTYSNALGIGNIRYFMVNGQGIVTSISEYGVGLLTTNNGLEVQIATELIFGNAVRDASGLVDINMFVNTMDFNNISAEINRIIRTSVIPAFTETVEPGQLVTFTGALELNQQHLHLEDLEIIPIRLEIGSAESNQ